MLAQPRPARSAWSSSSAYGRAPWRPAADARSRSTGTTSISTRLVLHALGLDLEQTSQYFGRTAPTFDDFERWIVAMAGEPERSQVARINAAIAGDDYPDDIKSWLAAVEADAPASRG